MKLYLIDEADIIAKYKTVKSIKQFISYSAFKRTSNLRKAMIKRVETRAKELEEFNEFVIESKAVKDRTPDYRATMVFGGTDE